MALTEQDRYQLGDTAMHYEELLLEAAQEKARLKALRRRQVVKAQDMPWENSRHGRIKHVINEKMDYPVSAVNIYMMVLPPGGRSGKHRHMAEELCYILEGKGYDLHWDPLVEIEVTYNWGISKEASRWEWAQGDFVYIPPMVAHQHFNSDPLKQARFLVASNRAFKNLGFPDYEQLEDAPDYKPQK
ncbi:cupin domain-containing protein [Chloroflexota bacterium]